MHLSAHDRVPAPAGPDTASRAWPRLGYRPALGAILLLGLVIRLLLLLTPRAYFPDEIFQYLEPAHRLSFGQGVVTWEYRYGIRSWLLPVMLAAPMLLGKWTAAGTAAYLVLPKLLIVAVSLAGIAGSAGIGRGISPTHGLFAAFVIAIWSEAALFGTQALTDALAASLFLPGAALLYGHEQRSRRALVLAGALLMLAAVLRFQYAPAIGLFVLIRCRLDRRCWTWGVAGAALIVALSSTIDIAMGQTPFSWVIQNFQQNIGHGRAQIYGSSGPLFYLVMALSYWGVWLIPVGIVACVGSRRFPALLLTAAANIAFHMLIAHKEYRFILLSTALMIVLAAVGTVDLVQLVRDRMKRGALLLVAAATWAGASAAIAVSPTWTWHWATATPKLEAFAALRADPVLCGVGIYGFRWSLTGGYTYLNRNVPIYVPQNETQLSSIRQGLNRIVAPPGAQGIPTDFTAERCFGRDGRFPIHAVCIYRRAGPCNPRGAQSLEINHYLRGIDR